METQWTIAQLERQANTGGVVVAHWRATGSETVANTTYTASSYGTVSFTPNAAAEGFIQFDDLTAETVIGWVQYSVNANNVVSSLESQIAEQKAPKTLTGMPWE